MRKVSRCYLAKIILLLIRLFGDKKESEELGQCLAWGTDSISVHKGETSGKVAVTQTCFQENTVNLFPMALCVSPHATLLIIKSLKYKQFSEYSLQTLPVKHNFQSS